VLMAIDTFEFKQRLKKHYGTLCQMI